MASRAYLGDLRLPNKSACSACQAGAVLARFTGGFWTTRLLVDGLVKLVSHNRGDGSLEVAWGFVRRMGG
jgi:hypothetical protein